MTTWAWLFFEALLGKRKAINEWSERKVSDPNFTHTLDDSTTKGWADFKESQEKTQLANTASTPSRKRQVKTVTHPQTHERN